MTVRTWETEANNNTDTPPSGAPEGWASNLVSDTLREHMACLAKWYGDTQGSLETTAGYSLTSNSNFSSATGLSLLVFLAHAANSSSPNLAVDGFGSKAIRQNGRSLLAGEIPADQVVATAYNSTQGYYSLLSGVDRQTASFTPAITSSTPRDLSVSYSSQLGRYWRVGPLAFFRLSITFTPTYATALGAVRVTGLPFTNASSTPDIMEASMEGSFAWPGTSDQFCARVLNGESYFSLIFANSASNLRTLFIDDLTSGSQYTIQAQGFYPSE